MVQSTGHKSVVLDHDIRTIELMRRFGFKGFFGDPTRPELLHAAGLDQAKVLVIALDNPASATKLCSYARRRRPDLHIIVRARDRHHVYELYQAGADDIVRELFDSSLRAGRYVLENIGLSEWEAAQAEKTFFNHDRYAVRELAKVWKPGVPSMQNDAYVNRTKELEKELETALMTALDAQGEDKAG
jgi:CPA2 family monovalent cation:H+ antiporter-2